MRTALNTAFAIAAALYRKRVTGEGQFIDVAMLDTAIIAQAAQFSGYLNAGKLIGLHGNASPTDQPTADVFPPATATSRSPRCASIRWRRCSPFSAKPQRSAVRSSPT